MRELWHTTYEVACSFADDKRVRSRLANLALAASFAEELGRLGPSVSCDEGERFRRSVESLALSELSLENETPQLWSQLADAAELAGRRRHLTLEAMDDWAAAFQEADPARKARGAYATPTSLARELVRATLPSTEGEALKIIDPSAGCGALLLAASEAQALAQTGPERIAQAHSLYGAEIDPAARELCCLLIWLAAPDGTDLDVIDRNIVLANALTHDWWQQGDVTYDVVVMNPPWESLRSSAGTNTQAERRSTVRRLRHERVACHDLPTLYSAQGTGDRNLYKAFLELAPHLVRHGGRIGALVPAAFASDLGATQLRAFYLKHVALESWTSFENRARLFPIDGRYKFGVLIGTRSQTGTGTLRLRSFCKTPDDVRAPHVELSRADLERLGGDSGMIPEVESRRRMEIVLQALHAGTPFFENGAFGSVEYRREVDLTLDREAGLFSRVEDLPDLDPQGDGTYADSQGAVWTPLLEGRMIGQYDFFQKSWVSGSGRRARWELNADRPIEDCQPQFVSLARPADWFGEWYQRRVAICDVTSATNTRTVLASWVPPRWSCGNTAPVLWFESEDLAFAGLAVLNSMVFDWLARRIVAGLHLNKFYLAAMAWPRVTSEGAQLLATLGRTLMQSTPRFGQVEMAEANGKHPTPPERLELLRQVEVQVASGYGLTKPMLKQIFSAKKSDRRGLWRYFAAKPEARHVCRAVLKSY